MVSMLWLGEEERELVVYSNLGKALAFHTAKIPLKTTKTTQGVQVMLSKKNSFVTMVRPAEQCAMTDIEYYKTKNIPAMGCFLKEEDMPAKQLGLF